MCGGIASISPHWKLVAWRARVPGLCWAHSLGRNAPAWRGVYWYVRRVAWAQYHVELKLQQQGFTAGQSPCPRLRSRNNTQQSGIACPKATGELSR